MPDSGGRDDGLAGVLSAGLLSIPPVSVAEASVQLHFAGGALPELVEMASYHSSCAFYEPRSVAHPLNQSSFSPAGSLAELLDL